MTHPVNMVEIWRGEILESQHLGHAVICNADGEIIEAWGDPDLVMLPRSSCKILQALPLVESGAADAFGLGPEQLALACASHQGAPIHTDRVNSWLGALGLKDDAFKCGPQEPRDHPVRNALIEAGQSPCRVHNNCSGKHAGFLTLAKHLGAGPDYVALDHAVQVAVREAYEDMTGLTAPGYGIDGCSAPNFATTLTGLARAMARCAKGDDGTARGKAAQRLVEATIAHPDLVAGDGRACTELMQAMEGQASIKTGAEAVFTAMLPQKGLGIAVKIIDGSTRGAECATAGLLVKFGVLDPAHPAAQKRLVGPIRNWDGLVTGRMALAEDFLPS